MSLPHRKGAPGTRSSRGVTSAAPPWPGASIPWHGLFLVQLIALQNDRSILERLQWREWESQGSMRNIQIGARWEGSIKEFFPSVLQIILCQKLLDWDFCINVLVGSIAYFSRSQWHSIVKINKRKTGNLYRWALHRKGWSLLRRVNAHAHVLGDRLKAIKKYFSQWQEN